MYVQSAALADTCIICGLRPPRFVFFALSGSLCNIVQLILDRCLMVVMPDNIWWAPTACWTLSYTLSISLRHVSHALCVFGQHADPPWIAIAKTYLAYLSTIIASTALNLSLIWWAICKPDVALLITAAFSVVWSYAMLSQTWRGLHQDGTPPACLQGGAYHTVPASAPSTLDVGIMPPASTDSVDVPAISGDCVISLQSSYSFDSPQGCISGTYAPRLSTSQSEEDSVKHDEIHTAAAL